MLTGRKWQKPNLSDLDDNLGYTTYQANNYSSLLILH